MQLNRLPDHLQEIEAHLVSFVELLRSEGIPVGTGEVLDALQAVQNIDLSQRSNFKTALQATLIKSYPRLIIFERLFERYFNFPGGGYCKADPENIRSDKSKPVSAQDEQYFQFKGQALQLSPEEKVIYSSLPEKQRLSLQRFITQTGEAKKIDAGFKPLLETVVKGHLSYWRDRLDREQTAVDGVAEGGGAGSGSTRSLREVDMSQICPQDLPAAQDLVIRLARQIASSMRRRKNRCSRSGPLDPRRTIRNNLQYGGNLYHLKFRRKHKTKLQLLLICDVSASMKSYSSFVLQFIHSLQSAVPCLESFIFSERLEYLTPVLTGKSYLTQIVDQVVAHSKVWGGGTDLGSALKELVDHYSDLLGFRTTVIIVSDTRTIALEHSLQQLQHLQERVRKIVWLNPLPEKRWPIYRSVIAISALVDMWPCRTIAQLEQVTEGILLGKNRTGYYQRGYSS